MSFIETVVTIAVFVVSNFGHNFDLKPVTSPKPTPTTMPIVQSAKSDLVNQTAGQANSTPSSESANVATNSDNLVSSGIFNFSDHKIKYVFRIPKNGGNISGSLDGVCVGSPSGTYNQQSNTLTGDFSAKCKAGPLDLVNVDIKTTFTGQVNTDQNKIGINWKSTSPVTEQGWFELPIE